MLKKMKKMYPHQTLMMIFILGLMIITGSFVVEHVFKVQPCDMCLWQRYLSVAITAVAFAGTLFRGKIKKLFLATISLLALTSLVFGSWQSLAQRGVVELPSMCAAPVQETVVTTESAQEASANLLADLKANDTDYVDCSKIEDFFLYNLTGISLANVNVILMLFIALFSFYKLFFKPRKRFRRYNNRRNGHKKHNNNNNRRYRGSGYHRSNNRNSRRHHHNRRNEG